MSEPIIITRRPEQDASQAAAEAAMAAGTTISGNLRWYGANGPAYRAANTADGRGVRVDEPT